MPAPCYILALLLTLCFTLATSLQLRMHSISTGTPSDDMLKAVLGDGRRMFANHYFVKADVYFHSGYYPSIFEQGAKAPANARHMVEEHHDEGGDHDEHEHEKAMDFLGQPKDWIDRFGRHFYSSTHSHLDKPGEAREILPWLRLSADLDPQRIETYTVAAYWLRGHLGKVDEAEQFLREGLRANPTSYEILFELGMLYSENHHDSSRARNLWELALRRWQDQDAVNRPSVLQRWEESKDVGDIQPDINIYLKIITQLALLEEGQGDLRQALHYRELEVKVSPLPELVQVEIDKLKQKLASPPISAPTK